MTRQTICKKFYLMADGVEVRSVHADCVAFGFKTIGYNENGDAFVESTHTANVTDFSEDMQKQAMLMGFAQKIGDAYADKDKRDELGTGEIIDTMLERLKAGDWNGQRGELGPRIGRLMEAVLNLVAEKKNVTVDELDAEVMAGVKEALVADDGRANAMSNSIVAAEYARLTAIAAQERAKKAKKAISKEDEEEGFLASW